MMTSTPMHAGRIGLLAFAVLLLTLAPTAVASAEDCPVGTSWNRWTQECETTVDDDPNPDTDPVDYESMGPVWDVVVSEVDGEECWMITQVEDGMTWSEANDMLSSFDDNGTLHDACDFGGGPPTLYTRWIRNECPPPSPRPVTLDPENSAITGKAGYLSIGGDRTLQVPCGQATIHAEARYVIHWGDGTTTETTSQGGGWPDGDLTHVYERKGSYTIEVEAYWTGTVNGTTLPELPVPTTAEQTVDVTEVQAVVTG